MTGAPESCTQVYKKVWAKYVAFEINEDNED